MPIDTGKTKAQARRDRKLLKRYSDNSFIIHENAAIVVIATGFKRSSANDKTGSMIHTWILRKDVNPVRAVETGLDFMVCGDCPKRPSANNSELETTDYLEAQALGWRTFTTSKTTLEKQVVCPASKEAGKRTNCVRCGLCGGTSVNARSIQIKPHGYRGNKCYVRVSKAPLSVWKAYKRGRYARLIELNRFRDRAVRFGSYGEPVLIPLPIMRAIVDVCATHTGYTHQWRRPFFQGYREFLMASTNAIAA
jgi:hypothetical protein